MLERLLLTIAFLFPTGAFGQSATSVPRPDVKVGDSWTYTRFDSLTKQTTGTFVNTVKKIEGGEITVESQGAEGQGTPVSNIFTSDWHVRRRGGREFTPAIPEYAFPLEVGKSWEGKYTGPDPRGASIVDYELKGRVVGVESVTVPAGTFDAVKVVLESSWLYTGPFTIGGSVRYGTFVQTIWYSPQAKRFVRMDVERHRRPSLERETWELKELKLN